MPRLKLVLLSNYDSVWNLINSYQIQGFIYSLLKDTEFIHLHNRKTFKYFNFSQIFPAKNEIIEDGKVYYLLISSPSKKFIQTLREKLKERIHNKVKIGPVDFYLREVKSFDIKLKFPWITATPIVLLKCKEVYLLDSKTKKVIKTCVKRLEEVKEISMKKINLKELAANAEYVPFNQLPKEKKYITIYVRDVFYSKKVGFNFYDWLEDLKRNSLEKFNNYFNESFELEGPLFDNFIFDREVAVPIIKEQKKVIYIGTLWRKLDVGRKLDKGERKFYKFLLDTGLGVRNSLGFGFVNPYSLV